MIDDQIKEERYEYLMSCYKPNKKLCVEANFKCDYHIDSGDQCPCEWALNDAQKETYRQNYIKKGLADG